MTPSKPYRLPLIIGIISLLGFIFSYISLDHHVTYTFAAKLGLQVEKSFCNISATMNCDAVNASAWSSILGIPVATYGLIYYAVMILLSILALDPRKISRQRATNHFLFLSIISVFGSVVLFLISKLALGVLCPLCLAIYVVNILTLIAACWEARSCAVLSGCVSAFDDVLLIPALVLGKGSFKAAESVSTARLFLIAVLLSAAAALFLEDYFVVKFLTSGEAEHEPLAVEQAEIPLTLDGGVATDHFKGKQGAPISVIEFGDFQCSACRIFHVNLHELLESYPEQVFYTLRNYPLDRSCNKTITWDFHNNACYAAELARCAGEQGKFWEMADYLFALGGDGEEHASNEELKASMTEGISVLGLDAIGMTECLDSMRHRGKIEADIAEGMRLKIRGTPAVWVNGKLLAKTSKTDVEKRFKEVLKK